MLPVPYSGIAKLDSSGLIWSRIAPHIIQITGEAQSFTCLDYTKRNKAHDYDFRQRLNDNAA